MTPQRILTMEEINWAYDVVDGGFVIRTLCEMKAALERIASHEAFGLPGVIDRSFSGLECQARMRVAREALEGLK